MTIAIRFMHEWPNDAAELGTAGIVQCTQCGVRTSGFIAEHGMVPVCSPDTATCDAPGSTGRHSIGFATSPESHSRLELIAECQFCHRQWTEPESMPERLPSPREADERRFCDARATKPAVKS